MYQIAKCDKRGSCITSISRKSSNIELLLDNPKTINNKTVVAIRCCGCGIRATYQLKSSRRSACYYPFFLNCLTTKKNVWLGLGSEGLLGNKASDGNASVLCEGRAALARAFFVENTDDSMIRQSIYFMYTIFGSKYE